MKQILKVQGDVYFVKIEKVDEPVVSCSPEKEGYVLAKGEATGHAHLIEDVESVKLYQGEEFLYLKVDKPVKVVHPEHKPITLEPGLWRVGIQLEYDYFGLSNTDRLYRPQVRPTRDLPNTHHLHHPLVRPIKDSFNTQNLYRPQVRPVRD